MALGAAVQAGILEGQVSDVMVLDVWQANLMRAFARQRLQQDEKLATEAGLDPEQLESMSDNEVASLGPSWLLCLGYDISWDWGLKLADSLDSCCVLCDKDDDSGQQVKAIAFHMTPAKQDCNFNYVTILQEEWEADEDVV